MTTIEFELTRDDYVAFALHSAESGSSDQVAARLRWISTLAMGLISLGVALLTLDPVLLMVGLVMTALVWVVVPRGVRWSRHAMIRLMAREDRLGRPGRLRLTLVKEGLRSESDHGFGMTHWSAMERVEESATHAFIFCGPRIALVVPKRVGAEATAFLTSVREQRARERSTSEETQPVTG